MKPLFEKLRSLFRRRPVLMGAGAVALIVVLLLLIVRPGGGAVADTAYYEVRRGDLTVSIVEGGTLAAVSEVSIRSDVEGTARIIQIVPEGSYAKKGDLLVELDSASAQDQVNVQQINFEKAKFAVEQAKAQLEIQRSATNSDFLAADLKLKFAKIDRDKYEQGLKMVNLVEASNKVVQAEAQLSVNMDTYINSTNLAAKGYETKQRVDGDRLAVLNTGNSLIVATNQLWMIEKFDQVKLTQQYEADILQAEQELDRVINQNKRKMAQFEADLIAQINTLSLSEQKLERDKKNLEGTKIYAPQDGLVVYQVSENRFSSESLIEGGAVVRNRQELIKLPDLSRMKVTIKVHESHVTMIRPGLPAFVVLDSMPDQRFQGYVERVAPLPDTQARWGNPNLKVYNTDVYLTDNLPNVRPGVSAKAEVIVTNLPNVLSIPIQAVATLQGKPVAYVANGRAPEPRPIEVGMFNTKFIEITKGLQPGERVLLSPPFDSQEKDLEGSVLNDDEKAKAATNAPVRPPGRPASPNPLPDGGLRPIASWPGPDATVAATTGPGNGTAGEGPRGGSGEQGGPGMRSGRFNPEEMMKQFDKNGDGQLDDTEREAMRAAMPRGGNRGGFNREEMLKRFDKNGDGQLDDEERNAMRASFGQSGPGGFGGPGGQGSSPEQAPGARRDAGGPRDRQPAGQPPQ